MIGFPFVQDFIKIFHFKTMPAGGRNQVLLQSHLPLLEGVQLSRFVHSFISIAPVPQDGALFSCPENTGKKQFLMVSKSLRE
jgi:hypothetical protein